MRDIDEIRDVLRRIGARFPISSDPPLHRPPVSGSRVTTISQASPPWAGLFPDFNVEAATRRPEHKALEELFRALDAGVEIGGVDALAWYVSFHNAHPDWGIYIPLTSVHYLSHRLFGKTRVPHKRRQRIALELLLLHEQFHFAADYAETQLELILGEPCRKFVRDQLRNLVPGHYLEVEEMMANAYMLRALATQLGDRQLQPIREFILRQPPGYCHALPYADNDLSFVSGLEDVVKAYAVVPTIGKNNALHVGAIDWAAFFGDLRAFDFQQCPVHFLHDDGRYGLPPLTPRLIDRLPDIRETKKFLKQYERLARHFQKAWKDTKVELSVYGPKPKQFEALRGKLKGLYSIRIGGGHRAHLRPVNQFAYWEAIDIGTHTEVGHD